MITFKGEVYVLVDQEMVPIKELERKRQALLDQTNDEIEQLFISTCSTEDLLNYLGETYVAV